MKRLAYLQPANPMPSMRNGGQPPNPRSLTHGANGLDGCQFGPRTVMKLRTARRQKPLWRRTPLRLLSSRAVSCGRLQMIACKALITRQLQHQDMEIRFCSVSLSGFEPSLSGFVPAPTEAKPLTEFRLLTHKGRSWPYYACHPCSRELQREAYIRRKAKKGRG